MDSEPKGRKFFSSQKIWAVLLVADSFFLILFGGALAATLYEHWQAPQSSFAVLERKKPTAPIKTAARVPAPRPAAAQANKPAAPVPKEAARIGDKPASAGPARAAPVVFELKASRARTVQLAGAFLIRQGGKESMRRKKGVWTLKVYLMPGSYRYYFLVNGKKKLDPADSMRKNGDSLLVVPSK
ncbi:MAG TPA: hypothetical protein VNK24_12095 [Elusimicrobiota bacterium]|nr:hypothetical protein [Elusimicrobiota bacterium]